MRRRTIVISLSLFVAACSEPLEFADWTIPVPEGTRVIEYNDPAIEERDRRIELIEDLVVGARGDDTNFLFFRARETAVDAAGRMYVADAGNIRVQVFDSDGEYLNTLGQQGEGPGELQIPIGLAIAGERVIVSDLGNLRLSTWDLDGIHVGDVSVSGRLEATIFGTDAGSIVAAASRRLEDRSRVTDVALYSVEGTEATQYVSLREPEDVKIGEEGGVFLLMPRIGGRPSFTAARSGDVYAAVGDEYQVLAFDSSGSTLWALRAARQHQPFVEEYKNAVLDPLREQFPELSATQVEWPEVVYAIGGLAVDGHGHLYVFPYTFRNLGPDEVPVEVYSPEGERLFAGLMSGGPWSAASGDFVYSLRRNEQTEEQELVRYRLVEPF